MKILVVDDSKVMRRIVINALGALKPEAILEAEDGKEACAVLSENSDVGLVLTDWNMPVMNGLALIESMRSNPATKSTPIVMITTESEKENVITAIKAGANNYVVKPFTPDVLLKKVQDVLEKANA